LTNLSNDSIHYPYDNYPDADFLQNPQPPLNDAPLSLIRQGLFFNEDAYRRLRDHAAPMGRGALVLLITVLIAGIAQGIGLAMDILTSPRIDIIQETIYDSITSMGWFMAQAQASPDFLTQFNQAYASVWEGIRIFGGYPSWSSTLAIVGTVIIGTFFNWIVYGFVAHWTARWFGGAGSYAQTMGTLALSYAPLVLTVVLLVPGAQVAAPFLFLLLFAAKFMAIRTAHGLNPASSLAIAAIPYVLLVVLLAALAIFGAAYGIGSIPFIDPIIRSLQTLRMF
jgi:hypothetical protein